MAVIVNVLQMPGSCRECELRKKCPHWNRRSLWKEEYMEKRADDCPLKSVDGLIAEIYDKFMTADGNLHDNTARKCIEIIREYCGEVSK